MALPVLRLHVHSTGDHRCCEIDPLNFCKQNVLVKELIVPDRHNLMLKFEAVYDPDPRAF